MQEFIGNLQRAMKVGAGMQIPLLNAMASVKTVAEAGRPVSAASSDNWTATVQRIFDAEAGAGTSQLRTKQPTQAGLKLSELLVAQTLRQILPSGSSNESGLAFDTWRGMLADAIAQEVAPHVNVLPDRPTASDVR